MSNRYKHGDRVPSEVLCRRLNELADAVTKGREAVAREFTMRVPAEQDRDADLVISAAAQRIEEMESKLAGRAHLPQDVYEFIAARYHIFFSTGAEKFISETDLRAWMSGHVRVPVEPTEKMISAAWSSQHPARIWELMLNASKGE